MSADDVMREFARKHGLECGLWWVGYTHTPWRAEFTWMGGEQVGFAQGKTAAVAVERAIAQAKSSGLLRESS